MTALVLENLATLPAQVQNLRMFLARMARAIDALVSARAARAVPEWQMRQVQSEINRYQDIIRAGVMRRDTRAND
jgi:multidrug resistance efflux pump